MRSRCVLPASPRHSIAQPELRQGRRCQQRNVMAGRAIDLYEIAVTEILDPRHRHIEGEHPEAPTFCNIQSKAAYLAPSTADGVAEPRPCGCRADRLAAGP